MTQEEASAKYLRKTIKYTKDFKNRKIGEISFVTAFLLKWNDDDTSIYCTIGPEEYFMTYNLTQDELEQLMESIEVLE